jgi:hypothetical protein
MSQRTEDEVPVDQHVANARPTHREGEPAEPENTTGPGGNGTFVGRVGGQDEGYVGETGAERRARPRDRQGAGDSGK